MKLNSRINLKVSDDFKKRVVDHCDKHERNISNYVHNLIQKDLDNKKDK